MIIKVRDNSPQFNDTRSTVASLPCIDFGLNSSILYAHIFVLGIYTTIITTVHNR
jgi:hypothetical protein